MKWFSVATELPNTEPSSMYVSVLFFLNERIKTNWMPLIILFYIKNQLDSTYYLH